MIKHPVYTQLGASVSASTGIVHSIPDYRQFVIFLNIQLGYLVQQSQHFELRYDLVILHLIGIEFSTVGLFQLMIVVLNLRFLEFGIRSQHPDCFIYE